MSIHVALHHVTTYQYDRLVQLGPQVIRLRPAPHTRARLLAYALRIEPAQHFLNWQQDPQANWLARVVVPEATRMFQVEVDLVVEMAVFNPFDFFLEPAAQHVPFDYDPQVRADLAPYIQCEPAGPLLAARLAQVPRVATPTIEFLVALNQALQRDIAYLIRMEPGVQSPEQTLALGCGSCRDSAWLLVQMLRHLGLAARFVSGYLVQLVPDVKPLDGPSGPTEDFTDLHAWCEVYLPGAGWIGLDPTSGLLAGEGHIPVACAPEPVSAAPITGAVDPAEVNFAHVMSVQRIVETPRVTQPYTEAQWQAIDAVGEQVDADLHAHDVRLTQGGEPTFVAATDRDHPQWNTEALGDAKRCLAAQLLQRLRRAADGPGFLHFGQGKWYPGEALPRWSLNWFWRRDGVPIVADSTVFAQPPDDPAAVARRPATAAEQAVAQRLAQGVARHLGLDPAHVVAAYEDPWYFIHREQGLPLNVDPQDAKLKDPLERERLARVFERGLDAPVGWVLPLAPRPDARALRGAQPMQWWQSSDWPLRAAHCYLAPGDSAMGYRLPLAALPHVPDNDFPWVHAADPTVLAPPLPAHESWLAGCEGAVAMRAGQAVWATSPRREGETAMQAGTRDPGDGQGTAAGGSYAGVARTALCIEPRAGIWYVFMPPAADLEGYLQLVAAVEAAAREQAVSVVFEGYEPPRDARLAVLRVTPDPGVIEVNVVPVACWPELVTQTRQLYAAAQATQLTTEKFMLDGRHVGTGGGNHMVLGGATPLDSPFLRRPDVLTSMIAWWLAHPSLSYLFSGLFIGPTSQAPRIDEARHDAVRALEIAWTELARLQAQGDQSCPPWLVDRVLRNLLVDVTGNTHRAEFCIDKLFAPDSATGRLGLLEMRGFEMPPHASMSLVQQLLLRALVARFWRNPLRPTRLPRWGMQLHDRWMLPGVLREDFCAVLDDLRAHGYPFEWAWFAPHFEFRFPRVGDFTAGGVTVTLRSALEPWPVMGEEGFAGGTVRFVDASVERLELAVTGRTQGRHVVTVNGYTVPLAQHGQSIELGAVRFRAWRPASCLHPTLGVHAPLTVDVLDLWNRRSLGGCRYHVAHPGGRHYDTFPVNAYEAEARRLARFFRFGHSPGWLDPKTMDPDPDMPCTLDLMRV